MDKDETYRAYAAVHGTTPQRLRRDVRRLRLAVLGFIGLVVVVAQLPTLVGLVVGWLLFAAVIGLWLFLAVIWKRRDR